MGFNRDDDGQVAGLTSLGAWFALPLEPQSRSCVDAGWDLDDQILVRAIGSLEVDRGLAAADGREERDGQVGLDRPTAPRSCGSRRAHPPQQVLEDPGAA